MVKVADKISYIGRDIEDAIKLGILDEKLEELYKILNFSQTKKINNSSIINKLVLDLVLNSSVEKGLCFSKEAVNMMDKIKAFNYKNIYLNERLKPANRYFEIVINELYDNLSKFYDGENTLQRLKESSNNYPKFINTFIHWIQNYWNLMHSSKTKLKNKVVFDMSRKEDYNNAIIYYISGMTDKFAIDMYNEIISF